MLSVGSLRPAWLARADALHVPFYSFMAEPLASAAVAAVEMARPAAVISVDLASRGPLLALGRRRVLALLRDLAPDVLFANDDEAAVIVDAADVGAVARLAPIVVIKHGATGCTVINSLPSPTRSLIATKPISAIDTTGAGDAFDAGFLFALLAGGYRPAMKVDAALLRRAALAGHRSAARLLSSPRRELSL